MLLYDYFKLSMCTLSSTQWHSVDEELINYFREVSIVAQTSDFYERCKNPQRSESKYWLQNDFQL